MFHFKQANPSIVDLRSSSIDLCTRLSNFYYYPFVAS